MPMGTEFDLGESARQVARERAKNGEAHGDLLGFLTRGRYVIDGLIYRRRGFGLWTQLSNALEHRRVNKLSLNGKTYRKRIKSPDRYHHK